MSNRMPLISTDDNNSFEEEATILAKFAEEALVKWQILPHLPENTEESLNIPSSAFYHSFNAVSGCCEQIGILGVRGSSDPANDINDEEAKEIINSLYSNLYGSKVSPDRKTSSHHDDSPFQNTPSPVVTSAPPVTLFSETRHTAMALGDTQRDVWSPAIASSALPKSCLKKRKHDQLSESTSSHSEEDETYVIGTMGKSVQFTPYPKSIHYYSYEESEEEVETDVDEDPLFTQTTEEEEDEEEDIAADVSYLAEDDDRGDVNNRSVIDAKEEDDVDVDLVPKKLFAYEMTPHPNHALLPRSDVTIHSQTSQSETESSEMLCEVMDWPDVTPSGPFQNTMPEDSPRQSKKAKRMIYDEYGLLSAPASLPFTDMFPPTNTQPFPPTPKTSTQLPDVMTLTDELLFPPTSVLPAHHTITTSPTTSPLTDTTQRKEATLKMTSSPNTPLDLLGISGGDVTDLYASYSQHDVSPSLTQQEAGADVIRFLQENSDLILQEEEEKPHQTHNQAPEYYDVSDPLALRDWPSFLWRRCKILHLPYPTDIPVPYHPSHHLTTPISSSSASTSSSHQSSCSAAIIYWVQESFYVVDNFALMACIWLARRLRLPVIAMVMVEEEMMSELQSYHQQNLQHLLDEQKERLKQQKHATPPQPPPPRTPLRRPRRDAKHFVTPSTVERVTKTSSETASCAVVTPSSAKLEEKKGDGVVREEDDSDVNHENNYDDDDWSDLKTSFSRHQKGVTHLLANAIRLQAITALQEELLHKYHIPLVGFTYAKNYRHVRYPPKTSANRMKYAIRPDIHPKAAAFHALLRSLRQRTVKTPSSPSEVFAVVTDDFTNPFSRYVSQHFLTEEKHVPFLSFDCTALLDLRTVEQNLLPSTAAQQSPPRQSVSAPPSEEMREVFPSLEVFHRTAMEQLTMTQQGGEEEERKRMTYALLETNLEELHKIQSEIHYYRQNQLTSQLYEVHPLQWWEEEVQGSEEEEEKKEDNPLRRCVRRCRRKRMTLRRNFQSLTFLPDVFVRFFIERSRHSIATNTTVITSLKEASVNEVPEQLEDDVAMYSVMSEVNLLPPPSLLHRYLTTFFHRSNRHYLHLLRNTQLPRLLVETEVVGSSDEVVAEFEGGEEVALFSPQHLLPLLTSYLAAVPQRKRQEKKDEEIAGMIMRWLLFYCDCQLTSAVTVKGWLQSLLSTSPVISSRLASALISRDYQRHVSYFYSVRYDVSVEVSAVQVVRGGGGLGVQYGWIVNLMRCFTMTSWQRMSEFFQRCYYHLSQLHYSSASDVTPSSLLSPKEFFSADVTTNPSKQSKLRHRFVELQRRFTDESDTFLYTCCENGENVWKDYVIAFFLCQLTQRVRYLTSTSCSTSSPTSVTVGWPSPLASATSSLGKKEEERLRQMLSKWLEEVLSLLFKEVFAQSLTCIWEDSVTERVAKVLRIAEVFGEMNDVCKEVEEAMRRLVMTSDSMKLQQPNKYPLTKNKPTTIEGEGVNVVC